MIKLCTLNVKGLNNKDKRIKIFKWLDEKNYSICLIQESHLTHTLAQTLKDEWDGEIYLSGQHTNKQGIAFLIKSNIEITVDNFNEIIIGRQASIDIKIHETQLTLINVYGPNIDDSTFYEILQSFINNNQDKNIIVGGDFNTVLNPLLDKKKGNL